MLAFGYLEWSKRGECLSAFFLIISRLSVLEFVAEPGGRKGELRLCWPGAKLSQAEALPLSGVLFLLLTLASVPMGSTRWNFQAGRRLSGSTRWGSY